MARTEYPNKWRLEVALVGPFNEHYVVATGLDDAISDAIHTTPFDPFADFVPGKSSFEVVVTKLRRRSFRKDLLTREAERLGALLAERMEDAEGWHGEGRREPAKRALNPSAPSSSDADAPEGGSDA